MNKQLTPLKKKIDSLAIQAEQMRIETSKDMEEATIVLSNINKFADSVKEQKDQLTKPINTALKNIRTMFKPLEESYEGAVGVIRSKMTSYQTLKVERALEEEKRIAERVAPGKGNLSIDTAVKKMAEIVKPEKKVSTTAGLIQFVDTKRFEVVDKTKVPLEFLMPDEVAIRKAMKEGRELEGIRYWTEHVPRNYR